MSPMLRDNDDKEADDEDDFSARFELLLTSALPLTVQATTKTRMAHRSSAASLSRHRPTMVVDGAVAAYYLAGRAGATTEANHTDDILQ